MKTRDVVQVLSKKRCCDYYIIDIGKHCACLIFPHYQHTKIYMGPTDGLPDNADAIANGCNESWSNEIVEKFVNKARWIKRSRYEQTGFPLRSPASPVVSGSSEIIEQRSETMLLPRLIQVVLNPILCSS